MAQPNHITKVAIVGVRPVRSQPPATLTANIHIQITGRIGKAFAEALLKTNKHQITALTRADTKGLIPSGITAIQIDYNNEQSLVSAMTGQQFLIITLSVLAPPETHSKLVQAAVKAGVPWIMPNVYGSLNRALLAEDPYTAGSFQKCEEIEALGAAYIAMCCGFWYEWSLALGEQWYGFSIAERCVTFFDDGTTRITSSTWDQCGRALAALLSLPESGTSPAVADWRNKPFKLASFTVSQRDMLDSLHRVLGTSDAEWTITCQDTKKRYADGVEEMKQGIRTGFAKVLYTRRFFRDGSGLAAPEELVNERLGLPREDLDEATRRAVEMVESGWKPF